MFHLMFTQCDDRLLAPTWKNAMKHSHVRKKFLDAAREQPNNILRKRLVKHYVVNFWCVGVFIRRCPLYTCCFYPANLYNENGKKNWCGIEALEDVATKNIQSVPVWQTAFLLTISFFDTKLTLSS